MISITFIVPGPPVPKARARVFGNHAYTPKRTKDHEKKIRALALVARQKAGQRIWTGDVGVEVIFYVRCPQKRPDCDNLLKTVLDACNGIIFQDDAQLTDIVAKKLPTVKTLKNSVDKILLGEPRTVITFWRSD